VGVLQIPNFFTPNGDGTNDYWHIPGIAASNYYKSNIYIFDRYGKLVAGLPSSSQGWDGTLNGHPLPSTDYWYVIELTDGRIIKGHFSLIR
jgi:gliding motility-associated-like protein